MYHFPSHIPPFACDPIRFNAEGGKHPFFCRKKIRRSFYSSLCFFYLPARCITISTLSQSLSLPIHTVAIIKTARISHSNMSVIFTVFHLCLFFNRNRYSYLIYLVILVFCLIFYNCSEGVIPYCLFSLLRKRGLPPSWGCPLCSLIAWSSLGN
jgi:hypothetical protein